MVQVLSNIDPGDHMANLLCLAVLAKFSSRPLGIEMSRPSIQSSPNVEMAPESADRFFPARKFFSSRRAPKTLGMAVINSITACSQSSQLSTPEIVETLRLSREIVQAFDKKEKSSWLAGNVGKIRKLCDKSLRPELEATVQCEVGRKRVLGFSRINIGPGPKFPRCLV